MFQYEITESIVISIILWGLYFIGLYLIIFWITIIFSKEYKQNKQNSLKLLKHNQYPKVTILVPAWNEEKTIEKTLKSLLNLDYDKNKIEIICINDGSTDNTLKILKQFQKTHNIKIIDQKNQGKYVALNNGIKQVKTDYLLCLDADSYPDKMALKYLVSEFVVNDYATISPIMTVHNPKTFIQKIQWVEYILAVFMKYLASHIDSMMVISGPFSLYDTKKTKQIGGFKEGHMTEDFEIALRFQKNDYKIAQSKQAQVYTSSPPTLNALIKQRIRWNYGNFMCMKEYLKHFFFKKKFQDFSLFVFPSMFLGSFFLIGAFILVIYLSIKQIIDTYFNFKLVNFDILTYIINYEIKFSFYDLNLKTISLLILSLIIIVTLFAISIRETKIKLSKIGYLKNLLAFIFYLFLYRFLIFYVWILVFKRVILKKKATWLK